MEQEEKQISGVKGFGEQLDQWMLYFYAIMFSQETNISHIYLIRKWLMALGNE